MNSEQIYRQLTGIFREVFEDQSITPTAQMTAADVAEWDSFNHINLIVAIEARFKIKFRTAELESLRNVAQLAEAIEKKVNGS
jgi:acyl carrier protein